MKTNKIVKASVLALACVLSVAVWAKQEKVLRIFSGGQVIQEHKIADIDYIEVHDLIASPEEIKANVSQSSITITWKAVEGATYDVYRSADNVNFTRIAEGITANSYTDETPLKGSNYYRVKAIVNGQESDYTSSVTAVLPDDDMNSGIYLGIYGFSRGLQICPIQRLTEENSLVYHSFVDDLTATEPFTWLYYAVDESINKLQASQFPKDLTNVAIVTFTDGLDIGSLDEKEKEGKVIYLTNAEYRDALHTRIVGEKVSGKDISAYTIGVIEGRGASLTTFRNNMNSLASSSANVFEVDRIENLNQIFKDIANSLSETNYVQKYVLSISGQSNGEKCKFTFDLNKYNNPNHNNSRLYIEGTYDRQLKAIKDITYNGMTSTSGTVVAGVYNAVEDKYDFTFEGLQANDGKLIPVEEQYIIHWFTDEGTWQDLDDEFSFDSDDADIEKIKRSAAIILNLDCSKSMNGTKFSKLQEAAHSFIQKLADNSIDPSEVASVNLDKANLTMGTGSNTTLKATVLPTTAKKKSVTWTSSDNTVATVNENGVVTALKPGNAIITVTTNDGGFTATCEITIVNLATNIELEKPSVVIYMGDSETLQAYVLPENTSNKEVAWKSSDPMWPVSTIME